MTWLKEDFEKVPSPEKKKDEQKIEEKKEEQKIPGFLLLNYHFLEIYICFQKKRLGERKLSKNGRRKVDVENRREKRSF